MIQPEQDKQNALPALPAQHSNNGNGHHEYDQTQVQAWKSYINVSEREAFIVVKLSNGDLVSLQHNYEGAIERGLNPWMHANRLPSWFNKSKACLGDISAIENIPLDFEWPADPSISHAVAQRMKELLVK